MIDKVHVNLKPNFTISKVLFCFKLHKTLETANKKDMWCVNELHVPEMSVQLFKGIEKIISKVTNSPIAHV